MSTVRSHLIGVAALTMALLGGTASADVLAGSFATAVDAAANGTPLAGWNFGISHDWFPNTGSYTSLLAVTDPTLQAQGIIMTATEWNPKPDNAPYIAKFSDGTYGGLLPEGWQQSSTGITYGLGITYTFSNAGDYSITDLLLHPRDSSRTYPFRVTIYLNDSGHQLWTSAEWDGKSIALDSLSLNGINAGDTVWVVLDSVYHNVGATFDLNFNITQIPEPAAIGLFGTGVLVLLTRRRP